MEEPAGPPAPAAPAALLTGRRTALPPTRRVCAWETGQARRTPGVAAAAGTSQAALQAEVEQAHGQLQEEHGQHRDGDQHSGPDPVEGI